MKKLKFSIVALMVCFIAIGFGTDVNANSDINIYVWGDKVETDVAPVIRNGRTLVPVRFVSESMGMGVVWNGKNRTVSVLKDSYELIFRIGSRQAIGLDDYGTHVERRSFTLDHEPIIVQGRTMVPIRFIAEQMNQDVRWDKYTRSVIIESKVY